MIFIFNFQLSYYLFLIGWRLAGGNCIAQNFTASTCECHPIAIFPPPMILSFLYCLFSPYWKLAGGNCSASGFSDFYHILRSRTQTIFFCHPPRINFCSSLSYNLVGFQVGGLHEEIAALQAQMSEKKDELVSREKILKEVP